MLALYSCMYTYIYPAYIIYYSQLQCFLLLTKKFLLDKIQTSFWRKWYLHLLMKSLLWQYKTNQNFKEKTSIFFKLLSIFFPLKMEKQKQTNKNPIPSWDLLPTDFHVISQVLTLGKIPINTLKNDFVFCSLTKSILWGRTLLPQNNSPSGWQLFEISISTLKYVAILIPRQNKTHCNTTHYYHKSNF